MPHRARYSNLDEVITCQHAVIRNLRNNLTVLLDELEDQQRRLSVVRDESAALRESLTAARHLMERRFPIESPGRD